MSLRVSGHHGSQSAARGYFPAFEIITANPDNRYYDDSLRGVTELGVAHVMRVFSRALSSEASNEAAQYAGGQRCPDHVGMAAQMHRNTQRRATR